MGHVEEIREELKKRDLQIWIAETTDAHDSEYVAECDNYVKYVSGFTGENATLIITAQEALLWVDGRFFLQAPMQTKGTGIAIMKMREPGVPTVEEWLKEHGFTEPVKSYENTAVGAAVWPDRPARPANPIKVHDFEWHGQPAEIKLLRVCEMMQIQGKKTATFNRLDDIAWVLNLRGSDIDYNPVFFAFLHIDLHEASFASQKDFHADFDAVLYVQTKALTKEALEELQKLDLEIREYESFFADYPEGAADTSDIIYEMKNVKSPIELFHLKECHVRDGIYVSKFIAWLKKEMAKGTELDEIAVSDYLDHLRSTDGYFLTLSFPTICGYGPNASIIHYSATPETSRKLEPHGFVLVDSGATYLDGTTDITRTIACGPLTDEEKLHYTLVLQGWLRLMHAKWKKGECSTVLDRIAREPLRAHGLDYNHGTGHGVGYANMVHEGPAGVSREGVSKKPYTFTGGEVVSDEPGIYIDGKHGVRIENMLYCKEEENSDFLSFENLTLVPVEKDAVLYDILTEEDKENLGKYMMLVKVIVGSYLTEDELSVLFE